MAEQWYYSKDGQQLGPVSEAEIKNLVASGQLQPADLVWNNSMANWTPAAQTPGLFASGAAPTSAPRTSAADAESHQWNEPVSDQPRRRRREGRDDYRRERRQPEKKTRWGLIIGLILGGLFLLFVLCAGGFGYVIYRAVNTFPEPPAGVTNFELNQTGNLPRRQEKQFTLRMQTGRTYTIDLQSRDFDSFLELKDGFRMIRQNDDGGQGLNSRIDFVPAKTKNYTIVVRSLSRRDGGRYRVTVHSRAGGDPKQPPIGGNPPIGNRPPPPAPNGVARFDLNFVGDLPRNTTRTHKIRLNANKTYIIDLMSNDFDCELILCDKKGKQLRRDDDGGPLPLDSQISYRPNNTDEYEIRVQGLGRFGGGNYRLTVFEQNLQK